MEKICLSKSINKQSQSITLSPLIILNKPLNISSNDNNPSFQKIVNRMIITHRIYNNSSSGQCPRQMNQPLVLEQTYMIFLTISYTFEQG